MIILNLNRFQKITNLNFDLTDERSIIYFLISHQTSSTLAASWNCKGNQNFQNVMVALSLWIIC